MIKYPILSVIAQQILGISASSASSERVFSIAGNVLNKRRNRLKSETIEYIMCLKNWGAIQINDEEDNEIAD